MVLNKRDSRLPSRAITDEGRPWRERLQAGVYVFILIWLNAYVCREFFWNQRAPMNSMHGFWSAIAKWANTGWFWPSWWPYWDCGIPFEFTYAPIAPGLTAIIAAIRRVPESSAFECLTGLIYCLGPVTLFLMAWLLTRLPGYSFGAALVYSLTAPSQIVVPDVAFSWQHLGDARRLYLMAAWDETPHMIALALLPLVVLFLALSIKKQQWFYRNAATVTMAGMALSSAFGPIEIGLASICLLSVFDRENIRRNFLIAIALGLCAYCISSPFLPPALMRAMHTSAQHGEGDIWNVRSATALSVVIFGGVVLWSYLPKWTRDWWSQFVVLFLYVTSSLPILATYFHRQFLPQPNRYKVEMEFAFALAAVFGARPLIERLPPFVKAALVFLLLSVAAEQIASTRRFAKNILRSASLSQSIEFRASTWAAQNLHGTRIMMPGSIAQWTNAFTDLQQFTGSSWSMAHNPAQQRAVDAVYAGTGNAERDVSISLAWLKGYGVGAVCVSGRESPEFWKPFQNPSRFQGVLPILWQAQDTTIYRIPQRSTSLAHVVPESAIVRHALAGPDDMAELERYVTALDDPALPAADFEWKSRNRIHIRADVHQGQVLSVQISYHPGWHARARSRQLEVGRDQLGLMWVRTESAGPSDIELEYNGGWELRISRWVSALSILLLLVILPLRRRFGASRTSAGDYS